MKIIHPKYLTIGAQIGFLALLAALTFSLACTRQSRGFVLPEGDIEKGKDLFVSMSCNHCHSINDIDFAGNPDAGDVHMMLGGEVTKVKTYGELVTSIINPSHKIAGPYKQKVLTGAQGSPMASYSYNEVMTVQELTDLVTFLQSEYEIVAPDNPYYYGN